MRFESALNLWAKGSQLKGWLQRIRASGYRNSIHCRKKTMPYQRNKFFVIGYGEGNCQLNDLTKALIKEIRDQSVYVE
jgi:hypothetical protein